MVTSKSKPNRAAIRFGNVLDEISQQVSVLKKFDLHFINVPRLTKLARFKAWNVLPKEFVDELGNVLRKPEHVRLLKKLGVANQKELLQQEWLHRFFRWEMKTNKKSHTNQSKSFGGTLFEKKVLNDEKLDNSLMKSARKQLLLMRDLRKHKPITFGDGVVVSPSDLVVKKATDFIDLDGRAFLDFAYLSVNNRGSGNKLLPNIEGQIKARGVVEKYYHGQGDRYTERFPKGFSCVIDGERKTFGPDDIFLDETFESGAGKALVHPEEVSVTDYQLRNTAKGKFTIDITYKASTKDIEDFITDLYQAKKNALSKIR